MSSTTNRPNVDDNGSQKRNEPIGSAAALLATPGTWGAVDPVAAPAKAILTAILTAHTEVIAAWSLHLPATPMLHENMPPHQWWAPRQQSEQQMDSDWVGPRTTGDMMKRVGPRTTVCLQVFDKHDTRQRTRPLTFPPFGPLSQGLSSLRLTSDHNTTTDSE